jgi:hypothetical protein
MRKIVTFFVNLREFIRTGIWPRIISHEYERQIPSSDEAADAWVSLMGAVQLPPMAVDAYTFPVHTVERSLEKSNPDSTVVKYKKRLTAAVTSTTDSCEGAVVQAYDEQLVPFDIFRQVRLHVSDECVAQLRKNNTQALSDLRKEIVLCVKALLEGVEYDAVKKLAPTNGCAALVDFEDPNFPAELMGDYREAQWHGKPQLLGGAQALRDMHWHRDDVPLINFIYTKAPEMERRVLMYSPEAIRLVSCPRYTGPFAGFRPGGSAFGTFKVCTAPDAITLDYQLRYVDSADDSQYYRTAPIKGWEVVISFTGGLFVSSEVRPKMYAAKK